MQIPNLKMEIFCPLHGAALTPLHTWQDLRDLHGVNQSELDPSITHYVILAGRTPGCPCKWLGYGTLQNGTVRLRSMDHPEISQEDLDRLDAIPMTLARIRTPRTKAALVDVTKNPRGNTDG